MNQLPDYLRFETNGTPLPGSVVCCGDVRITMITPRLIRLEQGTWTDRASTVVLHRDFCPCDFTVETNPEMLTVQTEYLQIQYKPNHGLAGGLTIRSLKEPGFIWPFGRKPLQNLGGTVSTLDDVEGSCPLQNGICSIDGYAFIDDSQSALFDNEGWLIPRKPCTDIYFFGYGHDYTACIQDYYRLTGAPQMLPAYVLGNWWSRYHAYSEQEYLDLVDRFEKNDVPLSVAIVDMDWHLTSGPDWKSWHNGWTGYTWNRELFPDYRRFLKALHDRNLRTSLNLHPAKGIQSFEEQYPAVAKRMGVDSTAGETIPCDYLNLDYLKAYFEEIHHPYEEDGVDFWWMDWQQGSDYAKIMDKHYKPHPLEDQTPLWMLNHLHYLSSLRKGDRGLIFSRFSGYGSQRYPIGFSGDSIITWDSLNFQPYFTATASNIGYGWWSHDIGGHYEGCRDDELTTRWIQLGVFSPVFRLHSSNSVFLGREPWRYNRRAQEVIESFMRLRHQLFPYLYTMCRRDSHDLIPLVRPMYHLYPEETKAYQVPNQYFFGSELMVAPITEKANNSDLAHVAVWFPEGKWIDLFTGYVYRGNRMAHVFRPLEQMPVFMKAGAIIPMQAHVSGSRKLGGSENMEVYLAPGADGSFRLYEDDGESLKYQNGGFCQTLMEWNWRPENATFRICPAEGDTGLIPAKRSWTVHFCGMNPGCSFTSGQNPVRAEYDPVCNRYTVVLETVMAEEGAELTVCCPEGILYDDRNARDMMLDCLTRAQCYEEQKQELIAYFDRACQKMDAGRKFRGWKSSVDGYNSLKSKVWELLHQIYEART